MDFSKQLVNSLKNGFCGNSIWILVNNWLRVLAIDFIKQLVDSLDLVCLSRATRMSLLHNHILITYISQKLY